MKHQDWNFVKQSETPEDTVSIERAIHEKVQINLQLSNPFSGKPGVSESGDAVVIGLKQGNNDTVFMIDNGLDHSVSVEIENGVPKFMYDDAKPSYMVIEVGDLYNWFTKQQIISLIGEALLDLRYHKMVVMAGKELGNERTD